MSDANNQAPDNLPPPVPPAHVPSVVDTLEPELAAAYRAGNPTIIQAVAAGATTSQMVVNDVIRMGVTTGLPPGVQLLVDERMKEIQQQQAAENERLKKLGAGIVEGALMATTGAEAGMYYGGEGNSKSASYYAYNPPNSEQFAKMSQQEQMAYLNASAAMTTEQWANDLSKDQRTQTLQNAQTMGDQQEREGGKALAATMEQMKLDGLSEREIQEVQDTLSGLNGQLPNTPEGQEAMRQGKEALLKKSPHLAKYVDAYQSAVIRTYAGADAVNKAYDGQKANDNDDHKGSKHGLDHAVKSINTATEVAASTPEFMECRVTPLPGSDAEKANKAQLEANSALAEVHNAGAAAQTAAVESAAVGNQAARAKAYDAVVASANKPQADDDYGDTPSQVATAAPPKQAPAKPGSAEFFERTGAEFGKSDVAAARLREEVLGAGAETATPRLTINAQPLGSAGMLQPEGVVAANDLQTAAPAAPEQQRPRVAVPTQGGMNA